MEIEGWMTNEYLFKSKADNECIVTLVKDNEMEIEKWMLENYYWK
jgi:hypothetical protein